MRILLTNDDGIHAPGFAALERIAATLSDDLWVVAPDEENSGAGHSLTLTRPLRVREVGTRRFAVSGTPTDCVMLALGRLIEGARPDLVLSGVNRGANLAEDVTYSGTISAAMEGTLAGIPSIALSQAVADWAAPNPSFAAAEGHGPAVIRTLLAAGWPKGVLINVNFPPLPADAVTGVRIARQGHRELGEFVIDQRTDARGIPYYWLGLGRASDRPDPASDIAALRSGAIAITPLHLDLTHDASMAALGRAFGS
jgi:5'-nucleotidase